MFGFLKDKLKKAISKFTSDVKEEVNEKVVVEENITENKKEQVSHSKETKKHIEKEVVHTKKVENKKEDKKSESKDHHTKSNKQVEEKVEKKDIIHSKKSDIKEVKKEVEEIKPEKKHTEVKDTSSHKKNEKIQIQEKKIEETKKHLEKEVVHLKKIEEKKSETVSNEIKKEIKPIQVEEKKENVSVKVEEKVHEHSNLKEIKKHIPIHKNQESKPEHIVKHEKHVVKEVKKEAREEKAEEPKKTGFFGRLFSKKESKIEEQVIEKVEDDSKEENKEEKEDIKDEIKLHKKEEKLKKSEEPETKKGFFEKISEVVTKRTLSNEKFDELFFELEVAMLENNVALEVIEKIKDDMKKSLLSEKVSRVKTEEIIAESLRNSIDDLFDVEKIDIFSLAKKKKPLVICFVGVNGSGKTTNLAKLANYFQKNGLSVVIAACDTFRAAAIQQIEEHAKKLDIKLIKHDYGADAAAVAFDAIEHAKAKEKDIVLIDTAGRSHANVNLMEELEKVVRVSKPDLKIFVGDSLTGNDAVDQAKSFNEKVGIDGIILSKVDVDDKGGAAISVSYITQKPILFIGTGQTYDDFEEFDKNKIIQNLGF